MIQLRRSLLIPMASLGPQLRVKMMTFYKTLSWVSPLWATSGTGQWSWLSSDHPPWRTVCTWHFRAQLQCGGRSLPPSELHDFSFLPLHIHILWFLLQLLYEIKHWKCIIFSFFFPCLEDVLIYFGFIPFCLEKDLQWLVIKFTFQQSCQMKVKSEKNSIPNIVVIGFSFSYG